MKLMGHSTGTAAPTSTTNTNTTQKEVARSFSLSLTKFTAC